MIKNDSRVSLLYDVIIVRGGPAGTAAALAVKNDCSVRDVDTKELQNELINAGAYL